MSDNVRFTTTADLTGAEALRAEIRAINIEVKQLQATLSQAQSFRGVDPGSIRAIESEITTLTSRAAALEGQLSSLGSVSEALRDRVNLPFASAAREVAGVQTATAKWLDTLQRRAVAFDPTIAATNKWIDAEQAAREKAVQLGIRQAEAEISAEKSARDYTLQRRLEVASLVDSLAQRREADAAKAVQAGIREADAEISAAKRARDYDLQRRLETAYAAEASAARQVQTGIKQADAEIAAARRAKEFDLQRRLDIAFQLDPSSERAAKVTRDVSKALGEVSMSGNLAQREMRHVVAAFDELASGRHSQFVATLGASLRDAGLSTRNIMLGLGALSGGVAAVHLAGQFLAFNRELEDMAENYTRMSAAIGVSTHTFAELSSAMRLVGEDSKDVVAGLEIIQKRMLEAVREPQSNAAQAFRQLGLSYDELRQKLQTAEGVVDVLHVLGDAFKRMGDTPQRTAIFTQLLDTREFARLIPLLDRDLDHLIQTGRGLGAIPPDIMIQKLKQSKDLANELDEAWLGFKLHVLGSAGMFDNVREALRDFLSGPARAAESGGWFANSALGKGLAAAQDWLKQQGGIAQRSTLEMLRPAIPSSSMGVPGAEAFPEELPVREFATWEEARAALERGEKFNFKITGERHIALPGVPGMPQSVREIARGTGFTSRLDVKEETSRPASGGATPFDWEEKAAERAYLARIRYAETIAASLHQDERRKALLQELATFEAMGPDQKNKFLRETVSLSSADAEAQARVIGTQTQQISLAQQLTQEQQQTKMAQIGQQETAARARHDVSELVKLEQQKAAIILANPYASQAEKIQAQTSLLQAQLNVTQQQFQLDTERAATLQRQNELILRRFEAQMQARVERGGSGITQQMAIGFDIEEVYRLAGLQGQILRDLLDSAKAIGDITLQRRVERQQAELIERTQEKIAELQKKGAEDIKRQNEQMIQPVKTAISSIGSAFESFFDAAITRSRTFSQAMLDLANSVAKDLAHAAFDIGGKVLTKSIGGLAGEGLSDFLARKISSGLGLLTKVPEETASATVASTVMGTAITTSGATAAAAMGTAITTAGTAAAAEMAAAVAGGGTGSSIVGAVAGKLLPIPGLEAGGIIPSAAAGMVVDSRGGQLAVVHPREMVLPAHLSTGIQRMIGGGGASAGGTNVANLTYSPTLVGSHPYASQADYESMLRKHGGSMLDFIRNDLRNSWIPV